MKSHFRRGEGWVAEISVRPAEPVLADASGGVCEPGVGCVAADGCGIWLVTAGAFGSVDWRCRLGTPSA
jgi:hypothetical protein